MHFFTGGYDGQKFLKTVECYDPVMNKWTYVKSMNVDRSRVALVASCGKLFAIGKWHLVLKISGGHKGTESQTIFRQKDAE